MTANALPPPNHPIALERVFFTRSIVVAMPDHKPGEGVSSISPENKIDVLSVQDRPRRYVATMKTIMNLDGNPVAPYMIDMECVGIFSADDTLTAEDARRGVMITAHSVLYGAIREAVGWITGRHPHGTLTLGLSILMTGAPPPGDD